MKAFIFSILVLLFFITSCNKNDVITEEIKQAPIIELDSETGIYTIKVGRELTIAPTYKYANNALYAWTVDGKLLSSESILKYTWNQEQHLYIKLRVDTPEGYAEEELKVEVLELTPPTISIIIPSKGLKVPQNTDYILSPDIQHDDLENFRIEWVRDGEIVGTEKAYTFHEKELGTYSITIRASNIDGETIRDFDVEVVETSFESCCGVITDFAMQNGWKFSKTAAESLYTGMVTDSGRFRYDATTPRTFRMAAFLLEQGVDINEVYTPMYADDFEMIKLRAQFVLQVRFTPHNVGYIYTTKQRVAELGVDEFTISRGMVGVMGDIRGVDITVNFTETDKGVLCELRSKKYNINPVAVKYGGGGHAKASGATVADKATAMKMLADLDEMCKQGNTQQNGETK